MNTRLSVMLMFVLSGLVASAANAQAGGAGASSGAASPYTQQRSQAYTSFDNPYAPGGIYDPYRGNKSLSSSPGGGLQSRATTSHKSTGSKMSSLSSTQMTSLGSGRSGSRLSGNSGGKSAGGLAQCGSGSSRLGGGSTLRGAGMNPLGSGMSSRPSSLGHCGSSSAYSHTSSGMGASPTSLNGRRGMNGQPTGMQQQQH